MSLRTVVASSMDSLGINRVPIVLSHAIPDSNLNSNSSLMSMSTTHFKANNIGK